MTEKLKCPFCGTELMPQNDIENAEPIRANCINPRCAWFMWSFPWEIWHALMDGKKAQDALIKEKTTHNILQERLIEHQKALEYAIGVLDNLTDIGGVDMEIIKIKEMAGMK